MKISARPFGKLVVLITLIAASSAFAQGQDRPVRVGVYGSLAQSTGTIWFDPAEADVTRTRLHVEGGASFKIGRIFTEYGANKTADGGRGHSFRVGYEDEVGISERNDDAFVYGAFGVLSRINGPGYNSYTGQFDPGTRLIENQGGVGARIGYRIGRYTAGLQGSLTGGRPISSSPTKTSTGLNRTISVTLSADIIRRGQ